MIASGLLCGVLAVIVLFTNRRMLASPLAAVVMAAIGLAAVLLQLRLQQRGRTNGVHAPTWLNVVGILLALAALLADLRHWSSPLIETLALGAVTAFAISGAIVLHAFRKQRIASK